MAMNRQRWLPPSDFTDPRLGVLPAPVRVTALGLRLYVDDEGRAEVRLRPMLAEMFEHDERVTTSQLEEHLLLLDEVDWLRLYVDRFGRSLLQVRVWPAVQHPESSQFDPPEGFMKPSRKSQETFMAEERGGVGASESGREWVSAGGTSRTPGPIHVEPEPPSPFCSEHQPWGTEDPCGPCGTARLSREIWLRAAARTALPRPASRPRHPTGRGDPGAPGDPVEFVDELGRVDCT